jgi:hypothetical protein
MNRNNCLVLLEQRHIVSQNRSFILKCAIVQEKCSDPNANAVALQYRTGPACYRSHNSIQARPRDTKRRHLLDFRLSILQSPNQLLAHHALQLLGIVGHAHLRLLLLAFALILLLRVWWRCVRILRVLFHKML